MDKNTLKQTVLDQKKIFEEAGDFVSRNLPPGFAKSKKISVISGVRRCGKSTLLKQISAGFSQYYYLNFEDERLLDFTAKDFNGLLEVFYSTFGDKGVFFFDEIQNVAGWEKFASRLFSENRKLFITGSNAKLLSSELATSLSGRHLKIELYPFGFKEFLDSAGFTVKNFFDTKEKSKLLRLFNQYLEYGGFPEIVISRDKNELKQLYQDILIKDLLVRFKIKDSLAFRELALYLLSNFCAKISFNNLNKILNFNSVSTVKNYVELLEAAYLQFTIRKYDYSLKKQIINDRKIYSIDSGLINAVSFAFSPNVGRLLENIVFLELKRRDEEIFYFQGKNECDFLTKAGMKLSSAIQVTETLSGDNYERETKGLIEAMKNFKINRGLILTYDQDEDIKIDGCAIKVMPVWKWLIGKKLN